MPASSEGTGSEVRMECTHCGVEMTAHRGSGAVRYHRCPDCHRWVSSTYEEVLKSDAKFRSKPREPRAQEGTDFEAVKARMERWLSRLDAQDPYRVLGVSRREPVDEVRRRYHALAMERHPDRGGSERGMRELNLAYEQVLSRRRPPA